MTTAYVVVFNNRACVATHTLYVFEPLCRVDLFPLPFLSVDNALEMQGLELTHCPDGWVVMAPRRAMLPQLLQSRGAPLGHFEAPIPHPRVKKDVQTRWSYGWQKMTRNGWVTL